MAISTDRKARILVVDDEPTVRLLLSRVLQTSGFDVVTAEGGELALELVRNEPFDLVLLDVMMPDVTGKEVCARLKAEPATASIPVIFVTALDDPEVRRECLALGAVELLTKPIRAMKLVETVRAQLFGARDSRSPD